MKRTCNKCGWTEVPLGDRLSWSPQYYCRPCINKTATQSRRKRPEIDAYQQILRGAAKRCLSVVISKESFYEWFQSTPKVCIYCDISWEQSQQLFQKRLTVDRKDNNIGYSPENICFACYRCNLAKGKVFTTQEWRQIAQQYLKPKWIQELAATSTH